VAGGGGLVLDGLAGRKAGDAAAAEAGRPPPPAGPLARARSIPDHHIKWLRLTGTLPSWQGSLAAAAKSAPAAAACAMNSRA
jgi:hypothetical protein